MSDKLLLPNRFKIIGWIILIPVTIFGIVLSFNGFEIFPFDAKVFAVYNQEVFGSGSYFSVIETDVTNTIAGALFIASAMLVGFSKEKREDEFIANLRLSSLLWAVCVNYILLLLSFVFVYGAAFLTIMLYNMFTTLIIFIIRFNYILYKNSKTVLDEK